jgi:hypothetical protein
MLRRLMVPVNVGFIRMFPIFDPPFRRCLRKVKIKKRRSEIAFAGREVPVSKNLATSVSLVSSNKALLSSIAVDRVFYTKQTLCQFDGV